MYDEREYVTDEWKLYEKGKNYNITKGLYDETEKNYDFYHGNQWKGAKLGSIQPITLNVIRPTVKYKLSVLGSNDYQVVFNPNTYENYNQEQQINELCQSLNKYSNKMWEKEQVNKKVRAVLKDSCINSEGIVHLYEEDGDIKVELIDKTNVYYGNENDDDIQSQPYILITYRRTVDSVKDEAKRNGLSEEQILMITSDSDYEEQSGRDMRVEEVSPMCLVILKYYKKDGTIWLKKSTRNVVIKEEANTTLNLYPVAHMTWEDVKGYARGIGEVKYMIPNQIEINKTATRRALAVQMCAYPKLVANMKYVTNPSALNKVGSTIELNEMGADDVTKVVNYLRPTTMSSDAIGLQSELMKDTQDLAGAGDTLNGNVDPTKASGRAILAVQQAGQQPLKEQLEKFKTFLEDLARIWFNMVQVYSTEGIIVTKEIKNPDTGEVIEQPYNVTQEELNKVKFNIKIDITPHGAYDKFAQEQSLENLFTSQAITFEEYVKSLPTDSVMPKQLLEKIIKDRQEVNKKMLEMEKQANALNGAMSQVMAMQEMNGNEVDQIANQGNQVNNQVMQAIGGNQNAM